MHNNKCNLQLCSSGGVQVKLLNRGGLSERGQHVRSLPPQGCCKAWGWLIEGKNTQRPNEQMAAPPQTHSSMSACAETSTDCRNTATSSHPCSARRRETLPTHISHLYSVMKMQEQTSLGLQLVTQTPHRTVKWLQLCTLKSVLTAK